MCNCNCHGKKSKKPTLSDAEKLERRREVQREYYKRKRDEIIAKNTARYLRKKGKTDVEIQTIIKLNKFRRMLDQQLADCPVMNQMKQVTSNNTVVPSPVNSD